MPPTLRLQRRFFRRWRRHGAFLCPTSWSGCSPRPTPLPWRPASLSASVRHWKIGLMPVRRWKRCRGSPSTSSMPGGENRMTYGKRTLIAVDQLINTLLGGWPDETLSSRCYRWARDGVRAWPRRAGGRAVLLAEGTLQEQLREREGRQAVPAGVEDTCPT